MTGAMVNVGIGLMTSILSGGGVWLWQRLGSVRALRRKARFFGMTPGGTCLIILNNKYDKPGTTHHNDVHALIEAATLAREVRCEVSVESSDTFLGSNEGSMEFCIGGPSGSNVRTAGHLAHNLPGVTLRPHGGRDSLAIVVGDEKFRWKRGEQEYALVAKFTPPGATRPVMLISGQRAVANHAALHFLRESYRQVAEVVNSVEQFCIIVKVSSVDTYGFQAAALERDVTAAAFSAA
ncbi:hypothetical protein PJ985_20975 [Streptomyces sp. ACA25]|uniref:hypothetical protein n=1 Tax=Streptomyces sp. ACA25 TaxID=3022596 RepID=UPI002307D3D2|nr:hypothetical protein [Streptomyces sp. ACA25]MDB1090036.1 hypothetical protein [Streptomyces sp. ACA25]